MKAVAFLLSLLSMVLPVYSQVKTPVQRIEPPPVTESRQAVVVVTKDWSAVTGTARLFERKYTSSAWKAVGEEFPIVVGRNGMEWSADFRLPKAPPARKREGDGKSPAGIFPLTSVFGTEEKAAAITVPYTKLDEFTECVDDIKSSHYNTIVDRMKVGNFDWDSSENMLAVGPDYGLGVFVAYNTFPIIRGNGSCIFLHVWKNAETGTAGCTAMERSNLERITNWLRSENNPYLIQMPAGEYNNIRSKWKFPKLK